MDVPAKEIINMLQKANKIYHTTTFELLLASLVKSVKEETADEIKVIELESHGREKICQQEFLSTIGWFTVLYPFSIDYEMIDMESFIIQTKENYRMKLKQVKDYAISHEYCKMKKRPFIKFNYLGDIDSKYNNFKLEPNIVYEGRSSNVVELDIINRGDVLKIIVKVDTNIWGKEKIKRFVEKFVQNVKAISYYCQCKKTKFTPSDFDTVDLSQKDIDELFI